MIKYRTFNFSNNNQFDLELPRGFLKGIGLSFEFTNQASQTLLPSELGQIRLYRRGVRIWEATIDNLMGLANRLQIGSQRLSSPTGSAGEMFVYIPFHYQDGNIVYVGGDEYYVQFIHSSITTKTTDCQLTLMLQSGFGFQRYFPLYNDFNIRTLSAESKPERFLARNLAYITVTADNNHTNFRLNKSGNVIYDMTDEQAEFVTNIESNKNTYAVAAASSATAIQNPWVLSLYKEKNLAQIWSAEQDDYEFGVVSTSSSVTGLRVEFDPSPLEFAYTAEKVSVRLQKVNPEAAKLSA